jgi:hypothetical protein
MIGTGEERKPTPPTAQRVTERAMILSAVVCHGFIDRHAADPESVALWGRVTEWLRHLDVYDKMEAREFEVINRPLGGMQSGERIRATWDVEGLAVLAWALRRADFPRHHEQVNPYEVTGSVGFLSEDAAGLMARARLRGNERLHACREVLYAVHCRLRGRLRSREWKNFAGWIEPERLELLGIAQNRLIVDGDLAVGGEPVCDVSDEGIRECESAVREQHRAGIWLVGDYPIYSELPVDT